jgi:hypothetical protein
MGLNKDVKAVETLTTVPILECALGSIDIRSIQSMTYISILWN